MTGIFGPGTKIPEAAVKILNILIAQVGEGEVV
jgi:hypothetical protein